MHSNVVSHLTLRVRDLDTVSGFYESTLGLELLEREPPMHRLGSGARPLLTLICDPEAPPAEGQPGLYHTAFLLPSREALGAWMRRYANAGAPGWQGASDHGVSEALYLADPEGNGIEVYADRPEETWQVGSSGEVEMYVEPLDLDRLVRSAPDRDSQEKWPLEIGHVHLQVSDLAASRRTFVEVLGLEAKAAFRDSALFLAYAGYHHHVGINTWNPHLVPVRDPAAAGLVDFSIRLPADADEEIIVGRAADAGLGASSENGRVTIIDSSGITVRAHVS